MLLVLLVKDSLEDDRLVDPMLIFELDTSKASVVEDKTVFDVVEMLDVEVGDNFVVLAISLEVKE